MNNKNSILNIPPKDPSEEFEDKFFDNKIALKIVLNHHVLNESEAAMYLRTSVQSIRYHALRTRKLKHARFSKDGLVFRTQDLDDFINNAVVESYRDP